MRMTTATTMNVAAFVNACYNEARDEEEKIEIEIERERESRKKI
jgi:hypothetical protein